MEYRSKMKKESESSINRKIAKVSEKYRKQAERLGSLDEINAVIARAVDEINAVIARAVDEVLAIMRAEKKRK